MRPPAKTGTQAERLARHVRALPVPDLERRCTMRVLAMLIGALVLIALVIYGAYCAYLYLKGNKNHE